MASWILNNKKTLFAYGCLLFASFFLISGCISKAPLENNSFLDNHKTEMIDKLKVVFQPQYWPDRYNAAIEGEGGASNDNLITFRWNNLDSSINNSMAANKGDYDITAMFYYNGSRQSSLSILGVFVEDIKEVSAGGLAGAASKYFKWSSAGLDRENASDDKLQYYYGEASSSCLLLKSTPGFRCPVQAMLAKNYSECNGTISVVAIYVESGNIGEACASLRP